LIAAINSAGTTEAWYVFARVLPVVAFAAVWVTAVLVLELLGTSRAF
jgi:hypothetical protein